MLLVLIIVISDFAILYGINTKVTGALSNAVDAATIKNLDNIALRYQGMDETLLMLVRQAFTQSMAEGLGADFSPGENSFINDGFLRHGVRVNEFWVGWHDNFPKIYASVSVKIDTVLLGTLVPEYVDIEVNNFDSLYWQWAY